MGTEPFENFAFDHGAFAVCVTASVSSITVTTFMRQVDNAIRTACPELPCLFTLIVRFRDTNLFRDTGPYPFDSLHPDWTSPYMGQPASQLYRELKRRTYDRPYCVYPEIFVILDEGSFKDANIVVCVHVGSGEVKEVRVPVVNAIDVHGLYTGALDIEDLQAFYHQEGQGDGNAMQTRILPPRRAKTMARIEMQRPNSAYERWKKLTSERPFVPKPGEFGGRRFRTLNEQEIMMPGWSRRSQQKHVGTQVWMSSGTTEIVSELEPQFVFQRRRIETQP